MIKYLLRRPSIDSRKTRARDNRHIWLTVVGIVAGHWLSLVAMFPSLAWDILMRRGYPTPEWFLTCYFWVGALATGVMLIYAIRLGSEVLRGYWLRFLVSVTLVVTIGTGVAWWWQANYADQPCIIVVPECLTRFASWVWGANDKRAVTIEGMTAKVVHFHVVIHNEQRRPCGTLWREVCWLEYRDNEWRVRSMSAFPAGMPREMDFHYEINP